MGAVSYVNYLVYMIFRSCSIHWFLMHHVLIEFRSNPLHLVCVCQCVGQFWTFLFQFFISFLFLILSHHSSAAIPLHFPSVLPSMHRSSLPLRVRSVYVIHHFVIHKISHSLTAFVSGTLFSTLIVLASCVPVLGRQNCTTFIIIFVNRPSGLWLINVSIAVSVISQFFIVFHLIRSHTLYAVTRKSNMNVYWQILCSLLVLWVVQTYPYPCLCNNILLTVHILDSFTNWEKDCDLEHPITIQAWRLILGTKCLNDCHSPHPFAWNIIL